MSKIGWPLAAVIAALVIAVAILGGALIIGGDGDDDDGSEIATVTVPVEPTGTMEAGANEAATAPPAVGPGDADPDPDDRPLGTAEARRAGRAAVAAVGGGTVAEVDRSDDPGEAYEVEVLTDQGEIDVALDHNLKRVPNAAYDDTYDDAYGD